MPKSTRTIKIAGLLIGAAVLLLIIRAVGLERNALPLEITFQVRNISAQETDWRVVTAAQPGDVLEHFLLIHLPSGREAGVASAQIRVVPDTQTMYREQSFSSVSQGIDEQSAEQAVAFFKNGITIPFIAPGEFVDFKWQTRLSQDVSFSGEAVPILIDQTYVGAPGFSGALSKTRMSLFSTQPRNTAPAPKEDVFFVPKIIGMNPRSAYDILGTGAIIAGSGLEGIKQIQLAENNLQLVWRLVSGDVIEAALPAGLAPGAYTIEFTDVRDNMLQETLAFQVLDSKELPIIAHATPNEFSARQARTIVLQGIGLAEDAKITMVSKDRTIVLQNLTRIADRVLAADIPETASAGTYELYLDNRPQHITIIGN